MTSKTTRNETLWRLVALALGLLALAACSTQPPAPPPTSTLDPVTAQGQQVFVETCGPCHSTQPDTIIVGPSLYGIAEHGATRVDGLDARAYIYSSILRPDGYLVEGYEDLMPKDLGKKLTGEELDSVVAYLLSLQ